MSQFGSVFSSELGIGSGLVVNEFSNERVFGLMRTWREEEYDAEG